MVRLRSNLERNGDLLDRWLTNLCGCDPARALVQIALLCVYQRRVWVQAKDSDMIYLFTRSFSPIMVFCFFFLLISHAKK